MAPKAAHPLGAVVQDFRKTSGGKQQILVFGGPIVVSNVKPGSRAEQMDLRVGDVVQRINGKDIHSVQDVANAVRDDETLDVEVLRDGKPVSLEESNGERPPEGL